MELTDNGKNALICALLIAIITLIIALTLIVLIPNDNSINEQTLNYISNNNCTIICKINNDTPILFSINKLVKIGNSYYLYADTYNVIITKK